MEKEKTSFFDRVVKNWKTSSVAIIAAAAIIASWMGFKASVQEISVVIIGVQAVILLFAKD